MIQRARNRGVLLERHVYPWFSEQGIVVSYWSDMSTRYSVSKESWCPSGATCLPMIQWARNRGVLVERHVYPWFSEQGIVVSYWSDMSTHDSVSKESWCPTGATCLPMIQWARNRGVLLERHVYPWFSEQGIVVSYWSDMSTHDSVSKKSWCPSGATCLPMIQWARNHGVLVERHVYPWFSEQGIVVP